MDESYCEVMTAIGGYFELELNKGEHYHKNALKLNTARNCFEYILRARGYKRIYMPYYTCEVMFQPLDKLKIEYVYYHINEQFEIVELPILKDGEAILYTNYFALKQTYVETLSIQYGNRLIVDNAQAFYAPRIEGIDTFYSARKFFGVPDGAYLYTDCLMNEELDQDISYDRAVHLLKRIDLSAEDGYEDFRKADDSLDNKPIRLMSKLTERIMSGIDYNATALQRRKNYTFLHTSLGSQNNLQLSLENEAVPMVYPFLSTITGLRENLIKNRIFVAKYWGNICRQKDNIEFVFANELIPIPIDQRYAESDINNIIVLITRAKNLDECL